LGPTTAAAEPVDSTMPESMPTPAIPAKIPFAVGAPVMPAPAISCTS
jgi:hypothetical protein